MKKKKFNINKFLTKVAVVYSDFTYMWNTGTIEDSIVTRFFNPSKMVFLKNASKYDLISIKNCVFGDDYIILSAHRAAAGELVLYPKSTSDNEFRTLNELFNSDVEKKYNHKRAEILFQPGRIIKRDISWKVIPQINNIMDGVIIAPKIFPQRIVKGILYNRNLLAKGLIISRELFNDLYDVTSKYGYDGGASKIEYIKEELDKNPDKFIILEGAFKVGNRSGNEKDSIFLLHAYPPFSRTLTRFPKQLTLFYDINLNKTFKISRKSLGKSRRKLFDKGFMLLSDLRRIYTSVINKKFIKSIQGWAISLPLNPNTIIIPHKAPENAVPIRFPVYFPIQHLEYNYIKDTRFNGLVIVSDLLIKRLDGDNDGDIIYISDIKIDGLKNEEQINNILINENKIFDFVKNQSDDLNHIINNLQQAGKLLSYTALKARIDAVVNNHIPSVETLNYLLELTHGLKHPLTDEKLNEIFNSVDFSSRGKITYSDAHFAKIIGIKVEIPEHIKYIINDRGNSYFKYKLNYLGNFINNFNKAEEIKASIGVNLLNVFLSIPTDVDSDRIINNYMYLNDKIYVAIRSILRFMAERFGINEIISNEKMFIKDKFNRNGEKVTAAIFASEKFGKFSYRTRIYKILTNIIKLEDIFDHNFDKLNNEYHKLITRIPDGKPEEIMITEFVNNNAKFMYPQYVLINKQVINKKFVLVSPYRRFYVALKMINKIMNNELIINGFWSKVRNYINEMMDEIRANLDNYDQGVKPSMVLYDILNKMINDLSKEEWYSEYLAWKEEKSKEFDSDDDDDDNDPNTPPTAPTTPNTPSITPDSSTTSTVQSNTPDTSNTSSTNSVTTAVETDKSSNSNNETLYIFSDGSIREDVITSAYIISTSSRIVAYDAIKIENIPNEYKSIRNVLGELNAIFNALTSVTKIDYSPKAINIFIDYEGTGHWLSGKWKIKNAVVREYITKIYSLIKKINVELNIYHVKSHTGIPLNECVDQLCICAKEGSDFESVIKDIKLVDIETSIKAVLGKELLYSYKPNFDTTPPSGSKTNDNSSTTNNNLAKNNTPETKSNKQDDNNSSSGNKGKKLSIDINKTAAIIGDKLDKLGGYNKNNQYEVIVKAKIKNNIINVINNGYDTFMTGMNIGVGQWAAEVLIDLKKEKEYNHIKIIGVIPSKDYHTKWTDDIKKKYINLCNELDYIVCLSDSYNKTINLTEKRDQEMLDRCSLLIVVTTGTDFIVNKNLDYYMKKNNNITGNLIKISVSCNTTDYTSKGGGGTM